MHGRTSRKPHFGEGCTDPSCKPKTQDYFECPFAGPRLAGQEGAATRRMAEVYFKLEPAIAVLPRVTSSPGG